MADEEIIIRKAGKSPFDSIKHIGENGDEYWLARELYEALGYKTWENFENVIVKAKVSISEVGMGVENHFRDVTKMVPIGYGNPRAVNDIELTRHACYVIAQNGSSQKPEIAAAQAYFAIQTRRQELADRRELDYERMIARQKFTESDKHISTAVMEKGISGRGLGQIKSSGDKKLFGGKTTSQMKKQYGITSPKTPLANRMPNVVLAAKSLANEMTAQNLEDYPIDTYDQIRTENDGNNEEVRKTLLIRGIKPESLPPAEDTDRILTRLKADDKRRAIEES